MSIPSTVIFGVTFGALEKSPICWQNGPAHRRRANGVRLSTETRSRRSVQPVCYAMESWPLLSLASDLVTMVSYKESTKSFGPHNDTNMSSSVQTRTLLRPIRKYSLLASNAGVPDSPHFFPRRSDNAASISSRRVPHGNSRYLKPTSEARNERKREMRSCITTWLTDAAPMTNSLELRRNRGVRCSRWFGENHVIVIPSDSPIRWCFPFGDCISIRSLLSSLSITPMTCPSIGPMPRALPLVG